MIDAVLFDIDDTLYPTTDFADMARRNAVNAMVAAGLDVPVDLCRAELLEVIREFGSNYPRHFDILLRRLPERAVRGVNRAVVVAAGVVAYHRTKTEALRPFDDVPQSLDRLRRAGVTLGIISAGLEVKQAEKLVRLGLLRYVEPRAIFITEQVGIGKPNPKLYARVLRRLGLAAERCLYVGDHPIKDIDPANHVGMVTVLCRRSSRHQDVEGHTRPDHEIATMAELEELLTTHYGVHLGEEAR